MAASPSPTTTARTAVVWLDPDQADLVRAVIAATGLTLVAAGCPQLGRSREIAESLGVSPIDDLRTAVTTSDADVMLLLSPGDFGTGSPSDVSRRRSAVAGAAAAVGDDWAVLEERRARGGAVFTAEPMPASVLQLQSPSLSAAGGGGGVGGAGRDSPGIVLGPGDAPAPSHADEWATFVPAFSRGPAMRAAADVLAHLGRAHTVCVEFVCGRGEGSLGARLFDAVETITSLLGDPESIDAMYVWPGHGKLVHPTVGESLRGLAGVLTANLRFPDGRAATLLAGDHAVGCAGWSRRATIIGETGRLTVRDDGFEFAPADGRAIDRSAPTLNPAHIRGWAAAAIADQITRAMDRSVPASAPTNYARVLSVTGAALLSARTGETESPETILRMARTA